MLDGLTGELRFHHIMPDLWVMETRSCAHRWVVFHETYSFCLVRHVPSVVQWRYDRRVYVVDRDHRVMAMQPGELHANIARTPPADFIVVQVGDLLMREVARDLGWASSRLDIKHPHPASDHPLLIAALRRFRGGLCEGLFEREGGRCTCCRSISRLVEALVELVSAFIQHCAEDAHELGVPERGSAPVMKAINYLYEHYNQPYDLGRLERAAQCGRYYLLHLFKRELGVTPSEFQNRVLVAKACRALAVSPGKPLDVIAHDIGWPGRPVAAGTGDRATLMIRHFRRTLGVTPGQFRANLIAMSHAERLRYAAAVGRLPRRSGRRSP